MKLRKSSQIMYLLELSQGLGLIFSFEFYYRTVSYLKFRIKPKWIVPTTVVFGSLYTSIVYFYPEWKIFEIKSFFEILLYMELYRNGRGYIFALNRSPGLIAPGLARSYYSFLENTCNDLRDKYFS